MKSTSPSIPSIRSLLILDSTIGRSLQTMGFALLAAAGIKWASQPVNSVVTVENSPIEDWVLQWGPIVALVVAALAAIILVRRYQWVKQVISNGKTITGTVEDLNVYEREESDSGNSTTFKRPITRTYYAIIGYTWNGENKKARIKLPLSPSSYQVFKGRDVDLLILDSAPNKPLIRSVYMCR